MPGVILTAFSLESSWRPVLPGMTVVGGKPVW